MLAGSAALLPFAYFEGEAVVPLRWALFASAVLHLLFVLAEITLPHVTAHAHLAVWEMTRGRNLRFFWAGVLLVAIALLAPLLGAWVALPGLVGLLAHEHAYVQAGQTVPLA